MKAPKYRCAVRFRVIPNGIVERDGKRRLRLVLAPILAPLPRLPGDLCPELNTNTIHLPSWPTDFEALLGKVKLYFRTGDEMTEPHPLPNEPWPRLGPLSYNPSPPAKVRQSQALWEDLLTPDHEAYGPVPQCVEDLLHYQPSQTIDPDPQVAKQIADEDAEIKNARATLQTMHTDPWSLVQDMLSASLANPVDALARQMGNPQPSAPGDAQPPKAGDPLPIIAPPRAAMARVVELIHATRLIDRSHAAAKRIAPRLDDERYSEIVHLTKLPEHDRRTTLHWTGTVAMMIQAPPASPPRKEEPSILSEVAELVGIKAAPPTPATKIPPAMARLADAIARRGVARHSPSAHAPAKHGAHHLKRGRKSFHRPPEPLDPRLDDPLPVATPELLAAVTNALDYSRQATANAHTRALNLIAPADAIVHKELRGPAASPSPDKRPATQVIGGAQSLHVSKEDIDQHFANLFAEQPGPFDRILQAFGRALDETGSHPNAATPSTPADNVKGLVTAAHAYHLIATFPEQRSAIVQTAQSINQAANRRFFGIMNHPGLARLLRLVIDVEVDLPRALEQATKVYVGACLPKDEPLIVWTACDLRPQEICETAFTPLARCRDPDAAQYPGDPNGQNNNTIPLTQERGLVVLGAKMPLETGQTIQANRFSLTNIEQNLAFEQILNKAKSQGESEKSASVEPDSGVGTLRSSGISIHDAASGDLAQQQFVAAQKVFNSLKPNHSLKPDESPTLYADNLQVGYALDVCVESRNGGVWGSLVERRVRLGKVGRVDVGALATEALTRAAAPCYPREPIHLAQDRFVKTVSGAILSPPTRTTTAASAGNGQMISQQTVGTWAGVPMGETAPSFDKDRRHKIEPLMDLPLPVTTDLRRNSPTAPARFEIGRSYYFGARAVYVGGVVVSLEAAARHYCRTAGKFTVPDYTAQPITPDSARLGATDKQLTTLADRRQGHGYVARRVERIGAPAISMAWSSARAGEHRNDIQPTVIVRSDDEHRAPYETPMARRVILPRSVAQAFAIQHPSYDARNARLLDDAPPGSHGPLGGLANVRISASGGMPMYLLSKGRWVEQKSAKMPEEGNNLAPLASAFFRIQPTTRAEVLNRPAPFYPDPAAAKTVIQIRTRGSDPQPLETIVVDHYDDGLWQDQGDARAVRCRYPHVIPILLEMSATDRSRAGQRVQLMLQYSPARDTGYADDAMRFTPRRDHGAASSPPRGQVTVRRVQVRLEPGEDYDVVMWSVPRPHALAHWFAIPNAAQEILDKAKLDVKLVKHIGSMLGDPAMAWPVPEVSDVTNARFCHATAIPPAPVIAAVRKQAALWLVRGGCVSNDDWQNYLSDNRASIDASRKVGDHGTFHAPYATDAWFGGTITFDQAQTGTLSIEAMFRDVEDLPGKALPDVGGDGQPNFPHTSRRLWSEDISPEPMAKQEAKPRRTVAEWYRSRQRNPDVMDVAYRGILYPENTHDPDVQTGKQLRNLHLRFKDTRARVLEVRPIATSRFVAMMTSPSEVTKSQKPFERRGDAVRIILPSTAQPAPMPDVELIQAFTWTYETISARRENVLRIQWRRPKHTSAQGTQASGCWYSSGEDEQLAIIFPSDSEDTDNVSYWARDPQRYSDPAYGPHGGAWQIFSTKDPQPRWMPLPQHPDESDVPQTRSPANGQPADATQRAGFKQVRFLSFRPTYHKDEDLWRVDLPLDTGATPGPYIELALARFQPHAARRRDPDSKADKPSFSDPNWDYSLSSPRMLGVRVQPARSVTAVLAGRTADGRWMIDVRISGSVSQIPKNSSGGMIDPNFNIHLLRDRGGAAADDALSRHEDEVPHTYEDLHPASVDEIRGRRLILNRGQSWYGLRVYVDERERRLSAVDDPGGYSGLVDPVAGSPERLVWSSILFSASIPIRKKSR